MGPRTLTRSDRSLTLAWADGREWAFSFLWLRDNCPCPGCLHPVTRERTVITAQLPDDVAPAEATLEPDGTLVIVWNGDRHESRYVPDWLEAFAAPDTTPDPTRQLWGAELADRIPTFKHDAVAQDDAGLLAWCEAMRDYGIAIIRGVPREHGEVERFASRVAFVRETVYDRLHDVRVEADAYNVASTALELKPHTDMPNYTLPPGVQLLHFLVNEAEGGDSTAVDGFHVARQLKERNPVAFDILARTPVTYRMFSEKGDVHGRTTMLTLDPDGELAVFRYSNQLLQPVRLPPETVEPFYDAYRALGRLVEHPENMIRFRMASGDMLATHNHRVLHGRTAFSPGSGDRHLQLSYLDFDDLQSRLRMLRARHALQQGAEPATGAVS